MAAILETRFHSIQTPVYCEEFKRRIQVQETRETGEKQ